MVVVKMVDYDGYIIAFLTNIDGFVYDNVTAIYKDLFRKLSAHGYWVLNLLQQRSPVSNKLIIYQKRNDLQQKI